MDRIVKTRHLIPLSIKPNLTAELDQFDHGLQMVEVEFASIEEALDGFLIYLQRFQVAGLLQGICVQFPCREVTLKYFSFSKHE